MNIKIITLVTLCLISARTACAMEQQTPPRNNNRIIPERPIRNREDRITNLTEAQMEELREFLFEAPERQIVPNPNTPEKKKFL